MWRNKRSHGNSDGRDQAEDDEWTRNQTENTNTKVSDDGDDGAGNGRLTGMA